ncbi:unnamed protein product [Polarella glacialis]|uniref:Hexose transporter 1 n=1 Tax=Polarella glacialis TaxID=89957 RepID=A0A813IVH7_POLGL|nr:unnamed protein product [Polarella glacialis]
MSEGVDTWRRFFSGMNCKLLFVGVSLQLIQQLCGLNVFIYYGPVIFQRIFRSSRASSLFSAVSGVVNFLSTFPALILSDRAGRMSLLKWSAAGMAACCVALAIVGSACFGQEQDSRCEVVPEVECGYIANKPVAQPGCEDQGAMQCGAWSQWVAVGAIFLFIVNFAYGWGPVVWLYCAEIFPLQHRTKADGLTTCANWVGNLFISFFPPILIQRLGFHTFWLVALVNVVGTWLGCVLPETKGRSLEDVQLMFEHRWGYQPKGEAECSVTPLPTCVGCASNVEDRRGLQN